MTITNSKFECRMKPEPYFKTFRVRNWSKKKRSWGNTLWQINNFFMPLIRKELPDIHLIIAGDFGNSYPEYQTLINAEDRLFKRKVL